MIPAKRRKSKSPTSLTKSVKNLSSMGRTFSISTPSSKLRASATAAYEREWEILKDKTFPRGLLGVPQVRGVRFDRVRNSRRRLWVGQYGALATTLTFCHSAFSAPFGWKATADLQHWTGMARFIRGLSAEWISAARVQFHDLQCYGKSSKRNSEPKVSGYFGGE